MLRERDTQRRDSKWRNREHGEAGACYSVLVPAGRTKKVRPNIELSPHMFSVICGKTCTRETGVVSPVFVGVCLTKCTCTLSSA